SNRLTGGPSNVSCLGNTEQMGEGWSDFLTVVFTAQPTDTNVTPRVIGTYALNENPLTGGGIRPAPYTTAMSVNGYTYGDTAAGTLSIPHGIGFVWNTILWEMYWNLVAEYGFNPDLYDGWQTGGNNLALQLVHDGLALQPCNPGFVSGRDAILAADQALTNGQNQCAIWNAFAKRGVGVSASEGSTHSLLDNVEAFDLPDACKKIDVTPSLIHACITDTAAYTVTVGQILAPPVTFTSAGHPADSTAVFSSPTVAAVPTTTTLTVSNLDNATAALYPLVITATNAFTSVHTTAALQLYTPLATQPQLLTPAHQTTTNFFPRFSWQGTANMQRYLLEIDDNADFSSPVYSTTVTTESHQPSSGLELDTTYFWRVTAANACGPVVTSTVHQFTTPSTGTLVCNGTNISFEAGLPADWLIYNNIQHTTSISWTTTADSAHCGIANRTNGSGDAACIDRDILGPEPFDFDAHLVTNPFDLSDSNTAVLQLQAYYRDYDTDTADNFTIDVWDGNSWENLLLWSTDHLVGESLNLDLSPYAGQNNVQLRFGYTGKLWDYYAQVDELSLLCGSVNMTVNPTAIADSAVADELLTHTVTISHTGELFDLDWSLLQDSNQQLDDNSAEESIGQDTAFIWLNRFTPTQFPFTLEEIWVQFGRTNVPVGAAVDLLVYEDTDGDHDPSTGAELIATYPVTIQTTTADVWSKYLLSEPLTFGTPRDILIGVVTRYNFGNASSFPAAIDIDSSQQRSWVGSFTGTPPTNPTIPTDDLWGLIDQFGFPGNWLIRGIGSTSCDTPSSWLTIDSSGGTLTPGTAAEIGLIMNAAGLSVGEYTTDLCLFSNDPTQPQINLPLTLTVVSTHHPQWTTLPAQEAYARHVYSQTITAVDEDPGDTLTITAALPDWLTLISLDHGRAQLYGTPAEEAVGQYPLRLTATDSEGLTTTAQITLSVTSLNQPPLATADVVTITENVPTPIYMISNDSDLENDPLTVITYTQPAHGQVQLSLNNNLLYTPTADFVGTDSLSYIVSDGYLTSTAVITIHVMNLPPTLTLNMPRTGVKNIPISFSLTISDTTIAPAAVSWQLGDGTHITNTSHLSHVYTTDGNYEITVTVIDVHGATATAVRPLVIRSFIFYMPLVKRP
ncbi:MAG: M36 family metallopeptidase, partial [Anaerolineales bacterium]|nr:M36 family metallopeptidase [Anaerolineales bacterium]